MLSNPFVSEVSFQFIKFIDCINHLRIILQLICIYWKGLIQIIDLKCIFLILIGFIYFQFIILNLDILIFILFDATVLKIWHLFLLIFIRVVY